MTDNLSHMIRMYANLHGEGSEFLSGLQQHVKQAKASGITREEYILLHALFYAFFNRWLRLVYSPMYIIGEGNAKEIRKKEKQYTRSSCNTVANIYHSSFLQRIDQSLWLSRHIEAMKNVSHEL